MGSDKDNSGVNSDAPATMRISDVTINGVRLASVAKLVDRISAGRIVNTDLAPTKDEQAIAHRVARLRGEMLAGGYRKPQILAAMRKKMTDEAMRVKVIRVTQPD